MTALLLIVLALLVLTTPSRADVAGLSLEQLREEVDARHAAGEMACYFEAEIAERGRAC